jgi:hypothetical protein
MRDRRSAARVVTKKDSDGALQTFAFENEVIDVALFFQNAGYFQFELRGRNINSRVLCRNSIADSG